MRLLALTVGAMVLGTAAGVGDMVLHVGYSGGVVVGMAAGATIVSVVWRVYAR